MELGLIDTSAKRFFSHCLLQIFSFQIDSLLCLLPSPTLGPHVLHPAAQMALPGQASSTLLPSTLLPSTLLLFLSFPRKKPCSPSSSPPPSLLSPGQGHFPPSSARWSLLTFPEESSYIPKTKAEHSQI